MLKSQSPPSSSPGPRPRVLPPAISSLPLPNIACTVAKSTPRPLPPHQTISPKLNGNHRSLFSPLPQPTAIATPPSTSAKPISTPFAQLFRETAALLSPATLSPRLLLLATSSHPPYRKAWSPPSSALNQMPHRRSISPGPPILKPTWPATTSIEVSSKTRQVNLLPPICCSPRRIVIRLYSPVTAIGTP